jgi:CheY-like chemotaxis protein
MLRSGLTRSRESPYVRSGPILVIEDHADSRDMLAQFLELWGYAVATATGGDDALALLDAGLHPRLVLLDLMLPDVSGWHVMEQLRADERLRDIPVVVVTAVGSEVLRRKPIEADAILQKPFNYDELQRTVQQLAGEP